ncbi:MAG: hypothetical protein GVY04_20890 [Cyanobacteria bacterium]|jgi:hypothetical protein|nr:hypothetical protein [Cyanobacteria bacterium GSL.Bin1]
MKKGASNFAQQKALLKPAFKLLKNYQLIVLGDREFHSLVLLCAIAYTFSSLKGVSICQKVQKEYVSRLRKVKQVLTKNSNFLVGLYGQVWIIAQTFVQDGIEELMSLNVNKLPFYQRGLRAMKIIQPGL